MQVRHNHTASSMLTVWAAGSREAAKERRVSLDDTLIQALVKNIAPQAPSSEEPRLDVQA